MFPSSKIKLIAHFGIAISAISCSCIFSSLIAHLIFLLISRRKKTETINLIRRTVLEMEEDALSIYIAIRQISQFVGAVVFFHKSEYLLAIYFHGRSNLSCSSLLRSRHYVIAMGFALVEYLAEITIIPRWEENWFLSNCGLLMILIGEVIRKTAIATARHAFNSHDENLL